MAQVQLITIHYVDNLGGSLLAYALQESVERLGHACAIVDYDPTPIPSAGRAMAGTALRRARRLGHYLANARHYARRLATGGLAGAPRHPHGSSGARDAAFRGFQRRHFHLGATRYRSASALEANPPAGDAFICGSDQVWNPYMCRDGRDPIVDPAYFLSFAPMGRRIAYAPSVAVPAIPGFLAAEFAGRASAMTALSCREADGARLVEQATGRPVEVVADPTLLLDAADWAAIAEPSGVPSGYVLAYFLGEGQWARDHARALASRLGKPLVYVGRDPTEADRLGAIDCCAVGPAQFLDLVRRADGIVTDSFHGTLFAINFDRPFRVVERAGSNGHQSMASRIHSILTLLGMDDRLLRQGDPVADLPPTRDAHAGERLDALRAHSRAYLQRSLDQVLAA